MVCFASRRRRAGASILGTVIMFAMLFTVGTSYFVVLNNSNHLYTESLLRRQSALQGATTQSLGITTSLVSGHVEFLVNNTGSVNANITAVLVLDSSGNVLRCDGPGLPSGASCGNTTPSLPVGVSAHKVSATIDTGYTYVSGTDTVQVVTQVGNTFSGIYPQFTSPYAAQAQSMGALTANLQTFKWMTPSGTQQSGGLVSGYPTIAVTPLPQPQKLLSIDSSGATTCSNSNTCTISVTTSNTNDVIYLAVYDEQGGNELTRISDSQGLSWTQRQYAQVSNTYEVYTYYAIASSALSSDTITAQFSSGNDDWLEYLAISNANTASPFDPNLSTAPTSTNSGSSTASVTFTTSNANDLIVGAVKWDESTLTPTQASGYTQLQPPSDNDGSLEYQVVGATGSYTPSFSLGGSHPWAEIGDAIQGLTTNVASQLPITLTNSQGSATPTTFQQEITWDPSLYSSYEASDLGNIRFCADSTCQTLLYGWLEGCSPSCSPSASSATAWVVLPATIAANGGTLTIYMSFLSTSTEFDGVYWGEAPNLSSTWGAYDNGASIFTQYGGKSWSSFTFVGGSWSTTNGYLQQTSTGGSYNGGPAALIESTSYAASGSYILEDAFSYTTTSTPRDGIIAVATPSGGDAYGYRFMGEQNGYGPAAGYLSFLNDYVRWVTQNSYQGSTNTAYTLQVVDGGGTWSGTLFSGYGVSGSSLTTLSSTQYTASNHESSSSGYVGITAAYLNGQGTTVANPINVEWFRMRAYPPNGVMPTVTFDGPGYLIFSATLTDEDPQGRAVTLWPDSSVAVVTTTSGSQQASTTVQNFYIVDGVVGGTSPTGITAYNSTKDFVTLAYNTPTTVYFAAASARGSTMNTLGTPTDPFQAMFTLTGQYGDNTLYGQTIPFPSGISTKAVATLSSVSGSTGTQITVSGNGFLASSKAVVGWVDSTGKVSVLSTFTTSSYGSVSTTFQVPSSASGYYTIIVTDFVNSDFFTFQHT